MGSFRSDPEAEAPRARVTSLAAGCVRSCWRSRAAMISMPLRSGSRPRRRGREPRHQRHGTAPAARHRSAASPSLTRRIRTTAIRVRRLPPSPAGTRVADLWFGGLGLPGRDRGLHRAAGRNGGISANTLNDDHVLVYFEPGQHLNVPGLAPGNDSAYIGGYSPRSGEATIDNGGQPGTTFESNASHVTIEYLTIKNFNGNGERDSFGGSIVDEYGGYDWTVDYDTVRAERQRAWAIPIPATASAWDRTQSTSTTASSRTAKADSTTALPRHPQGPGALGRAGQLHDRA